MLSEQKKVISAELDTEIVAPMHYMEKQIVDKIAKLRTMNVDPYDSVLSAIRNINIYPKERKPAEQKKNPPKKKHIR